MRNIVRPLALFMGLCAWAASGGLQARAQLTPPSTAPIRGAHYPALSPDGKRICFSYLGDLWTAESAGGAASRITTHQAYDGYPRWSPDGRWIAFSSNRDGNFDLYLVPARGGEPRQITYHSADDFLQDWSPDGTALLFQSAREDRFQDLYTLSLKDHRLRRLTVDRSGSRFGAFHPSGATVAYARGGQEWWRPKYEGSRNSDLYTVAVKTGESRRLTSEPGFDSWPQYGPDGTLFFVSHRGKTSELYRLSSGAKVPVAVTSQSADPVRFPNISRDGSAIVFEKGFDLYLLSVKSAGGEKSAPRKIAFHAPSDELFNWKQRATLTNGASQISLSQDGKTMALVLRGDIWSIPTEKGGDAKRLTKSPSLEASPAWSPDAQRLLYTTDRGGSLDIYTLDVKTRTEKPVATDAADEADPTFSPDGKLLAFVRRGGPQPGLFVVPIGKDFELKPSDFLRVGSGSGITAYDWSPDGRWLAYSRRDATGTLDIWVVPSVGGTPVNITRYPGMNTAPRWTRDGRHLVFRSSRGSAPGAFAANVYAVELLPPPPDAAENTRPSGPPRGPGGADEEELPEAQRRRPPAPQAGQAPQTAGGPGLPGGPPVPPRASVVRIEFEDIHDRAKALTNSRDGIATTAVSPDSRTVLYATTVAGQTDWWVVDIVSGSTIRITSGAPVGTDPEFAPDASRFYYLAPGGTINQLVRQAPAPSTLAYSAYLEIDRRAEIAAAFNQAWRELRTQFYDPGMHGADWQELRSRYESLLPEIAAKEDFAWLLQSMVGELNASHTGATPPAGSAPSVTTGYLGLEFDQDYAGPGLKVKSTLDKGPADQLGRRVDPGQYVLAIDGTDVSLTETLYRALEDKAGKTVELLVGDKPSKEGARTIKVRPITAAAARDLEYDAWVEERRRKVDDLSGGRLAYMHIKAMDRPSLEKFQRELFGYAQGKEGLVLDVRFNGGGRIHDDLLGLLIRKPHAYETPRDAERSTQPFQLWARPTILLINEYSASDAEIFPNGFREYGLGKLVGVPTSGAVIGTTNITLVDGTTFRIPRTGWTTLSGRNLENWGVPPDIRVEMEPEDYAKDDDTQLKAAVSAILKEMDAKAGGL